MAALSLYILIYSVSLKTSFMNKNNSSGIDNLSDDQVNISEYNIAKNTHIGTDLKVKTAQVINDELFKIVAN